MNWTGQTTPEWPTKIDNIESKREIANALAARARNGDVIGIGSGSTSFLALLALAGRVGAEGLQIQCVPTSLEIEACCTALDLPLTTLVSARPNWCFDGADEVDPERNMIKGRGGAFVREQLVFAAAPKRIILVDASKFVDRLGQVHKVPLAVVPEALNFVKTQLTTDLGSTPTVRPAGGKDGGVIDEQGYAILDLPIDGGKSPVELEQYLLTTPGIAATGLFVGYDYEIIS